MSRQRGLTLLELLVVLAIIGVAMTGVSLSVRDNSQTQLEREAQRLVAMLEAARAQSRTSGIALIWQTTPEGFVIRSALDANTPRTETWLSAGTQAAVSTGNAVAPLNAVVLGPEPILAPARITLSVALPNAPATAPANTSAASLTVSTDGLRPFQVVP